MRALLRLALVALVACGNPSRLDDLDHQKVAFTTPGGGYTPPTKGGGGAGAGVTSVSGGTGVNVASPTTTPTVSLDNTVWQQRVTGSCGAGNAARVINSDGSVTCQSVGVTSVTCGTDLTGGTITGTGTCAVDETLAQHRVGGTCANGLTPTGVNQDGTLICSSVNVNDYAGKHLEFTEEFLWGTAANNANFGPWNIAINGTGAGFTANSGTTTRPGIVEATAGTTTTGNVWFSTSTQAIDFGSYVSTETNATVGVPTLSTGTDEYNILFGYLDTNTINQVDGCYFMYDRGNTATAPGTGTISGGDKWECWCAANSVRTGYTMDGAIVSQESFTTINEPLAALTLPSTNIFNLRLVVTGTTRAEFYVNGTKSCDINTNIPSGSARLTGNGLWIRKSAGTTARLMDVDRMRLAIDMAAVRSP
jgi:hypothetical protein